ncbi:TolC family protein [Candidatus Magnetominusculus dajiuhuensis]|uniref:TolC family protein n=1 Tax=Candidatus Magnetominusculus dajiuhuensis TaxID=3137712 RepID=UPI003B42EDDD
MAVLFSGSRALAEDRTIAAGEYLTLENCIDIALKQQPNLMYYLYQIHANEAEVGQAQSGFYPSLDLQSGYTRAQIVNRHHDSPYSTIINKDDYYGSAELSQTIFDFGKTLTNVKMRNYYLLASKKDYEAQANTTALNVKSSYYGVVKAKRARDVDAETVKKYEQQLDQAKDFYDAGTKARYDVTQAEVNLSGANISLMNSENALAVAWDNLTTTMGIIYSADFRIDEDISPKPLGIKFEDALAAAYSNRPDLMSAIAAKDAAEKNIEYAKKDYFPVISGTASYNYDDGRFPLNNGWMAGVVMKWNIFSGFNTRYKAAGARAAMDAAESKIQSMKLSIYSGVRQSYLNLKLAGDVIPAAELQVKLAQENLDIATLKYEAGLASPVDYTDAVVQYKSAKLTYINALYNYKIAQAAILWAMGSR